MNVKACRTDIDLSLLIVRVWVVVLSARNSEEQVGYSIFYVNELGVISLLVLSLSVLENLWTTGG